MNPCLRTNLLNIWSYGKSRRLFCFAVTLFCLLCLARPQHLSASELADFILAHLAKWSGRAEGFEDDLTLIVIDVRSSKN